MERMVIEEEEEEEFDDGFFDSSSPGQRPGARQDSTETTRRGSISPGTKLMLESALKEKESALEQAATMREEKDKAAREAAELKEEKVRLQAEREALQLSLQTLPPDNTEEMAAAVRDAATARAATAAAEAEKAAAQAMLEGERKAREDERADMLRQIEELKVQGPVKQKGSKACVVM